MQPKSLWYSMLASGFILTTSVMMLSITTSVCTKRTRQRIAALLAKGTRSQHAGAAWPAAHLTAMQQRQSRRLLS